MASWLDQEVLVEQVEKYPCLWNCHDQYYSDKQQKLEAYTLLAKELVQNYDTLTEDLKYIYLNQIEEKWTYLRNSWITKSKYESRRSGIYAKMSFLSGAVEESELSSEDETKTFKLKRNELHKMTPKLIDSVKMFPCLWDKSDRDSRNYGKRLESWEGVVRDLYPTEFDRMNDFDREDLRNLISKRWTHLKDAYRRYLKIKTKQKNARPYMYAREMKFCKASFGDELDGIPSSDDDILKPAPTPRSPLTLPKKKGRYKRERVEKVEELDFLDNEPSESFTEMPMPAASNAGDIFMEETSSNRHMYFFKSIIDSIKDFTNEETTQFQISVLETIQKICNSRQDTLQKF